MMNRLLLSGMALAVCRRPCQVAVLQNGILRYSAARRSRNQNGPRLWSKTQPQRVGIAAMLRLVLRTQPRYENSSRLATILGDTDRVQLCDAVGRGTLPSRRRCSPLEPPVPGWEPLRNAQ